MTTRFICAVTLSMVENTMFTPRRIFLLVDEQEFAMLSHLQRERADLDLDRIVQYGEGYSVVITVDQVVSDPGQVELLASFIQPNPDHTEYILKTGLNWELRNRIQSISSSIRIEGILEKIEDEFYEVSEELPFLEARGLLQLSLSQIEELLRLEPYLRRMGDRVDELYDEIMDLPVSEMIHWLKEYVNNVILSSDARIRRG